MKTEREVFGAESANRLANSVTLEVRQDDWGWLPTLSLVSAVGLLLLALADAGGRSSAPWADLLFWIGLLVVFVPVSIRILSRKASRRESIALLLLLTTALYVEKILAFPLGFAYNDEFQSLRTLLDIVNSTHLFQPNPTLAVGPAYPGLQIVTEALGSLSTMPIFPVAIITLGTIRLVMTLALFLVYEHTSRSMHLAAIASLLYTGNPLFVVTNSQYAYSSVGIPLAFLALYLILKRLSQAPRYGNKYGLTLVAVLGLGALTVTHHITSYLLVAFLMLWFVLSWRGQPRHAHVWIDRLTLGFFIVLSVLMAGDWLVFVGGETVIRYLISPALGTAGQLILLLAGRAPARLLFQQVNPLQAVPLWERIIGISAAALILIGQPYGVYQAWKRYRTNPFVIALAASSFLYPLSLVVRFTSAGAFLASRITEYSFFPLAFILALGVMAAMDRLRRLDFSAVSILIPRRLVSIAMSCMATTLFLGGIVVGAGQTWWHTPGPFIASADVRSISLEGIDAAEWALSHLGPRNRVAGDYTNRLLMGSYGDQKIVPDLTGTDNGQSDKGKVDSVFFSSRLGSAQEAILRQLKIHYLVVDLRLSNGLPASGFYFDDGEPDAYQHVAPIDRRLLTKFDESDGLSRLFDSGNIIIYDTGIPDGLP